jgi:serine/threonine-protein kinase
LRGIVRSGIVDVVYVAYDLERGSIHAIQLPAVGKVSLEQEGDWFKQQAEALACVRHPLLISVDLIGQSGGTCYVGSTYPADATLMTDPLGRSPDLERCLGILRDIAAVLQFVHEHWHMVHGDLNPGAVVMRPIDGEAIPSKPSIFGSCLSLQDSCKHRGAIGSPALRQTPYMSPEQRQCEVQRVDFRSDVYSLGAILYHMLCGSPPSPGQPPLATDFERTGTPRRRLMALHKIAVKAMAAKPNRRYQSVGEFSEALAKL